MANLQSRVEKLERQYGRLGESPNAVVCFIRPSDRFCSGYLRIKTGEAITQDDAESDDDFVARAKAAGFGGRDHATP